MLNQINDPSALTFFFRKPDFKLDGNLKNVLSFFFTSIEEMVATFKHYVG